MSNERSPSANSRRPEDWTASEKLEAVVAAAQLSESELGVFLRTKGLHEAQLTQWRQAALEALSGAKPSRVSGEGRRLRELEREVQRKDKALAETAALLVLQKKVRGLWGGADDSTDPESDT